MESTTRTQARAAHSDTLPTLSWRSWPLFDHHTSVVVLVIYAMLGATVWYMGGGWLLTAAAVTGLAASMWRFFVPVVYEITPQGLRRRALGRTRLVPWHTVRSFEPRTSGLVLYQRSEPSKVDLMRSMFIPFPADSNELICALRQNATQAYEVVRQGRADC